MVGQIVIRIYGINEQFDLFLALFAYIDWGRIIWIFLDKLHFTSHARNVFWLTI